jgi:NADPH-dependent ferric siderophore reductase
VRDGKRNRFTARRATVISVEQVSPAFVRVTVGGPDFHDFTSGGPADHVRVFFPDPQTGDLVAPTAVGPNDDGIVRPDAPTIARDYTPLNPRLSDDGHSQVIDLDFSLHDNPGPATAWAASAAPGDQLVVVGPRGSKQAPQSIDGLLLVVDDTALPSASRWLSGVPVSVNRAVIALTRLTSDEVRNYLAAEAPFAVDITVIEPHPSAAAHASLEAAVREREIGPATFVFAAGEAEALVPIRRYLRRELGLPPEQVAVSGYWRAGVVGFDHHEAIDPSDPD